MFVNWYFPQKTEYIDIQALQHIYGKMDVSDREPSISMPHASAEKCIFGKHCLWPWSL